MAKNNKTVEETTTKKDELEFKPLMFEKSFVDTKYHQHFTKYSKENKQTEEQISLEIIKRMVFQKSLIGYVDTEKKDITEFNPKAVPAQNILKLRDDSNPNEPAMGIPVFTGIEQKDAFITKPREANIKEDSYINWMLIEFLELLAAVKNDKSIFQSLIINCEAENSQTVIMRENAKSIFDNILSLEQQLRQIKIKPSLDNADKNKELEKYMKKVVAKFKKIKSIRAFKFINQLIFGNGYIFEYSGEKKYEDLLEIAKICSELTPPNVACWYAFADPKEKGNKFYETIWKDGKFVYKLDKEESSNKDKPKKVTTKKTVDKESTTSKKTTSKKSTEKPVDKKTEPKKPTTKKEEDKKQKATKSSSKK